MKELGTLFGLLFVLVVFACGNDDNGPNGAVQNRPVENLDLSTLPFGGGVLLQGFYWDVEPRFEWWNTLASKLAYYSEIGVDRIWLPPASKGQSGEFSMGYDPSDYFDFGDYFQHNTTKTRFGSREELEDLISAAHELEIEVVADIVMGHNSGGGPEFNPYRNKDTYTAFDENNGNASGKFNRSFEDFHPNDIHSNDGEALFFEEQDLCHERENVQDWFWKNENSVAKYYKDTMGFDGWRFDYVKSFAPRFVKAWVDEVGGWTVGEYFDGDAGKVRDWINGSGTNAFDFPCLFAIRDALEQENLGILKNRDMLWKTDPEKAVTFVANHDTDREPVIANGLKSLAYAFILTHPGYPTIFYSDIENLQLRKELENLILINGTLAVGTFEVLYVDDDEYVAARKGEGQSPGLLLYMNLGDDLASREVETGWADTYLGDYSRHVSGLVKTEGDGEAVVFAPANGYSIWSVNAMGNP